MVGSLEILKPGLMTSIQDLGRSGLAYYAIPTSGAMDISSAKVANLLLNQPEHSPLIECTSMAPHVRFHSPAKIVITGADFKWTISDQLIQRNTPLTINKGDILKGSFTKDGLRGYIAIEGVLDVDEVYDSYATYTNARIGGYKGRLLKKGDLIEWETRRSSSLIIPIHKGPEYDALTGLAKFQLTDNLYKIGADSNRMGARLEGHTLDCAITDMAHSVPVLPGFIQLPPSGLPIVVLQDGQTTGGYPRIAYVPRSGLSFFNQIPFGSRFQFSYLET